MGLGVSVFSNGTHDPELSSVERIEIVQELNQPTRFSLRLGVDIVEGDFPRLHDGRIDAGAEITVQCPLEDGPATLVQGPVHCHRITFRHGGEGSALQVEGSDNLITLDRETQAVVWAEVTDSEAVAQIIGTYGWLPDVDTTTARHTTLKNTLVQRETDLFFLRRLAQRNGFRFWLESDNNIHTFHWKRPALDTSPSSDIVINLDSPSVQTFDLEWDTERPTRVIHQQVDAQGKSVLDGGVTENPDTLLSEVGLSRVDEQARSILVTAPSDEVSALTASSESVLCEAQWFIRARCVTEFTALGGVVRAGELVTVRGLGSRHSGVYLVESVRHTIDDTAHTLELGLVRNAWGAS